MLRKRKLDKSVVFIVLIVTVFISMLLTGYFFLRSDALTDTLKKGKLLKMLFIVSDGDDVKFMDTFFYNPKSKKGGIFYIPANVGSRIESVDKVDKISILYKNKNVSTLRKKVEQLLNTDIPFYIDFPLNDLTKMIDLLEGIEVFISNPVAIDFNGSKVLLPSGNIVLDGDKTKDYIQYSEAGEEERDVVFRKQKFLQALFKRIGEADAISLLNKSQPFDFFYSYMNTNISKRDLKTFIQEMPDFDTEHIYPGRIEGKVLVVEGKELLFPHSKGDYVKLSVNQMIESIMSEEVFDDKVLSISLEIFNGTEVTGLAGRAESLFENYGYDVIKIGNADNTNYDNTVVIDRKGNMESAKKIAEIIRCEKIKSEIKTSESGSPDVTLIVGKDFDGRYCKK